MKTKNFLIAAVVCGVSMLGISPASQAAELTKIDSGIQTQTQELSHWTQFRDGFLNILGVKDKDKDNDRDRRDDRHRHSNYRHQPPPPPPPHHDHDRHHRR